MNQSIKIPTSTKCDFLPFFLSAPSFRKEWLDLKVEYMTLQKRSMGSLKKCISKIDHQEHKSLMEMDNESQDGKSELRESITVIEITAISRGSCTPYVQKH